jgi:hypothetical protein
LPLFLSSPVVNVQLRDNYEYYNCFGERVRATTNDTHLPGVAISSGYNVIYK